jgi:hypothetical protein
MLVVAFESWKTDVFDLRNGLDDARGRSLDKAKNTSRMREEKDVKEPQKPVARPIYRGIVFLTLP